MTARRRPAARRSPNELGSVRQERSGRFSASFRLDGKTYTAGRTFETRADANAWLAAERVAHRRGLRDDLAHGDEPLASYAPRWLAGRTELAPRTVDLYERSLHRWVLPRIESAPRNGIELGAVPLNAITPAVVRTWHGHLIAATHAAALERIVGKRPGGRAHPAREWGRRHGFEVKRQGLLSPALLAAWEAAGSPDGAPDPDQIEHLHRDAGRTAAAQAYRVLHSLLTTATDDGLIPANPARLRGAGTAEHRERTWLTPEEVDQLAELIDEPVTRHNAHTEPPASLRAAVVLAAWSGLRYGELFALARRHVNLTAGTIRVERALVKRAGRPVAFDRPKSNASRRTVHLPAFVLAELRAHMAHHTAAYPDALLFTVPATGNPISAGYVTRRLARARALLGRPEVSWHDLRHTGSVLAYTAGATQRDVMNRLGHRTAAAAQIYAHVTADGDAQLARRLDALRTSRTAAPSVNLAHIG